MRHFKVSKDIKEHFVRVISTNLFRINSISWDFIYWLPLFYDYKLTRLVFLLIIAFIENKPFSISYWEFGGKTYGVWIEKWWNNNFNKSFCYNLPYVAAVLRLPGATSFLTPCFIVFGSASFTIFLAVQNRQNFSFQKHVFKVCSHCMRFQIWSNTLGLTFQRHSALINSDSEELQVCFSAVHHLNFSEQRWFPLK